MLTPQDLQEISFEKAKIGGYVMKSVDDVLVPLIDDYVTLYKENAVLKSKMRLLVERLEEYRASEAEIKTSADQAQLSAARIVEEAQRKADEILAQSREEAQNRSKDADSAVAGEEERLRIAKAATAEFVAAVEAQLARQQLALDALKGLDLPKAEPRADEIRIYERSEDSSAGKKEAYAAQIAQNVGRITGSYPPVDPSAPTRVMQPIDGRASSKLDNLMFGKNYKGVDKEKDKDKDRKS